MMRAPGDRRSKPRGRDRRAYAELKAEALISFHSRIKRLVGHYLKEGVSRKKVARLLGITQGMISRIIRH